MEQITLTHNEINFVHKMPKLKDHHTVLLRLVYKLLIFVAIIQQNYGNPTATNTPLMHPPFEMELSSPVPFTTRKPEISNEQMDEKNIELLEAASINATNSSTLKTLETFTKDVKENANSNDDHYNIKSNNADDSSYEDYLESDIKVVKTTPTSMEQQDDPVIPPTTITFSNVAAAGILGNSNSNIDGVVLGNGGDGSNEAGSVANFNDATPPYAAVDDKYGKIKQNQSCIIRIRM